MFFNLEGLQALSQGVSRRFADFFDLALKFLKFILGESDFFSKLLRLLRIGSHRLQVWIRTCQDNPATGKMRCVSGTGKPPKDTN